MSLRMFDLAGDALQDVIYLIGLAGVVALVFPAFAAEAPRLAFARVASLVLVARHAEPMPESFVLSKLRGATARLRTGEARFDAAFDLSGSREVAVLRIFAGAPLRDALLALFGPERNSDGRGLLVAANERGLVIYWDGPRAARVTELARAVPEALRRLSARRNFF